MASPTAVLALLVNAFVWGVSWWPFRELQAQGLHPLWATAFIYALCVACLLAVKRGAWRAFASEPRLWLLAAGSGLTNVGFNWGVTVGDVVRVVLLFYLMPAWSVLLAWGLLGERPTRGALLRLLLALAGVVTVLKGDDVGLPLPRDLPDWLALMGGFSFALTNVMIRRLHAVPAESRVLAMFGGGAALATAAGLLGAAMGTITGVPALGTSAILHALILSAAFLSANLGLQYGASRLAAHTTALVMLSEVVFASVSSALAGASQLNGRVLAGAAMILGAAAWSALSTRDAH